MPYTPGGQFYQGMTPTGFRGPNWVAPRKSRTQRIRERLLSIAARLTGRIWFWYYDEATERVRLYFGKKGV